MASQDDVVNRIMKLHSRAAVIVKEVLFHKAQMSVGWSYVVSTVGQAHSVLSDVMAKLCAAQEDQCQGGYCHAVHLRALRAAAGAYRLYQS